MAGSPKKKNLIEWPPIKNHLFFHENCRFFKVFELIGINGCLNLIFSKDLELAVL